MKKKGLVLSTIFFLLVSILFPSYSYASMDFEDLYVSDPTILKDGVVIGEDTEINYHQNVSLSYTYNIPNDVSIVSGDTMNFRIPSNTIISGNFSYDILAVDGTLIMTISGDLSTNTVIATFGPYYELNNANRQGEILFYARGASMTENQEWVMNKVGWNSMDNTSAVWNIIINPDSHYITNVILTDILGDNQEFDSNFLIQAELGTYDKTTQYFQALEPIDPSKISKTDVSFVVDLGTLNNAVSLTYVSNKLDALNLPYRNRAILEADGQGEPIIIDAETLGVGGGGSGSGDPGSTTTETTNTSSTDSSTIESTTTSVTSSDSSESTTETPSTSSTDSSTIESTTTSVTNSESTEDSTIESTSETAPEETTETDSSTVESTTTSESHENVPTNSSTEVSTSVELGKSSNSVRASSSSKLLLESTKKLPKTGYLKSMIGLFGYVLVVTSVMVFFFNKKHQKKNK